MNNQANNAATVSGAAAELLTETPVVDTTTPEVTPVVAAVKAPSKADRARDLFDEMAGSARKDVIKAFQEKIGLSAAASATYYQNIKSKLKAATAPVVVEPTTEVAAEPAAEVTEAAAESTETIVEPAQDPVTEPVAEQEAA